MLKLYKSEKGTIILSNKEGSGVGLMEDGKSIGHTRWSIEMFEPYDEEVSIFIDNKNFGLIGNNILYVNKGSLTDCPCLIDLKNKEVVSFLFGNARCEVLTFSKSLDKNIGKEIILKNSY